MLVRHERCDPALVRLGKQSVCLVHDKKPQVLHGEMLGMFQVLCEPPGCRDDNVAVGQEV
jgi:hypothetical protein